MTNRHSAEDSNLGNRLLTCCATCEEVYVGEEGTAGLRITGEGEQCPCGSSEFERI
jgi:hypothetical protein